jgi:nucleoside-diphosphate-sugar epimerase
MSQKKKILVCGATGFIGRNVALALARKEGFAVQGTFWNSPPFSCPGITLSQANLTKAEDVTRAVRGMDVVIQAAATTSGAKDILTKPYHHVTDNAVMNSLIFRACFEHHVSHVIFFSCSVMYPSSDAPLKETDFDASKEMHPSYFGVGWTKVYSEKMCEFYSRIGPSRYTVIRHSNIYGPYDKYDPERSHVVGATVRKVVTARDGKILVWGNGEEERDVLYVSDLVNFVECVLDNQEEKFGLFNVAYGQSISVRDLVAKILVHSGRSLRIEYDTTLPTVKTKNRLSTERVRERFQWSPKVSLDEGIRCTLSWYEENLAKTSDTVS